MLQQELARSKPFWHPQVSHPATHHRTCEDLWFTPADISRHFHDIPLSYLQGQAEFQNMVSLLVTHTKLCHLPQGHAHLLSSSESSGSQRVSVSDQSERQVIQQCFSSLLPAPASAHGHTLRTLRHRICSLPLLPLSALCCNSWGEGERMCEIRAT